MVKLIEECENGTLLSSKKTKVFIHNLGPNINTTYPEYTPVMSDDEEGLLFTSRRPSTTGGKRDPIYKKFFQDIYMASKDNHNSN